MAKKKKNTRASASIPRAPTSIPGAPASNQRANTEESTSQGNQRTTQPAPPTIPQLSTAANVTIGRILPELHYLPLPDRRATIRNLLQGHRQEEKLWILAAQCEKDGGNERVANMLIEEALRVHPDSDYLLWMRDNASNAGEI